MSEAIELLQFPYSHFNEKARWALDFKRVPHARTSLLPGPHAGRIKRLTGKTEVPVLRFGEEIVGGSARILEELERRFPDPPLVPADPRLRERALGIQRHFDDVVGPLVRRSLFAVLVNELDYVVRIFASERNPMMRMAYRAALPLVRPRIRQSMGITGPASIEEADRGTAEAFDFVARESAATGYLVGDTFTVADLAAASLLAPAADPPGPSMQKPRPMPESVARWLERWADHPGTRWVHEIYRRHRPASAETGLASAA